MNAFEPFIWIVWDLLAVFIFFHHVYNCAKKGFVSTVVRAFVYVGAVVAAHKLYLQISGFLYENVVSVAVRHVLTRNINQLLLSSVGYGNKNVLEAIPTSLKLLLAGKRSEVSALSLSDGADALASSILESFLKTPILSLLHAVTFLVLFAAVTFAIKWLANLFNGINSIPLIGWLNILLGGVLGVLIGCVTLFIAAFLLRLAVNASDDSWWWLSHSVMDATYIWRVFWGAS